MLTRLHVDNYRCLVNFELRPGRICALLGDNGTGKSMVAEVLQALRRFLCDRAALDEVLPLASLTRWQRRPTQDFTVELRGNSGLYVYSLTVERDLERGRGKVASERLTFDKLTLAEFGGGVLRYFNDDGSRGPEIPSDWARSGVGAIFEASDNTRLTWFRRRMTRLYTLSVNPWTMETWTEKSAATLRDDLRNFTSWFRGLVQRKPATVFKIFRKLGEIIPGFVELAVEADERHERGPLSAIFEGDTGRSAFEFGELSDGQRALIALYTLRFALDQPDTSLVLDEPYNFVALREIQPWLFELLDASSRETGPQVILTSHHPEVLDTIARDHGLWFSRTRGGPTQIRPFAETLAGPLPPSEQVASGWNTEDDV